MTIEAKLDRIIELLEAKAANPTKPKATKPTPAPAAATAEPAPAPAASPETTAPASAGSAPVAKPTEAAATPAKDLTLDDVRNALVKAQTRLGSKEKPKAVLDKFSKTGTTGGLAPADYARLIAECETLK